MNQDASAESKDSVELKYHQPAFDLLGTTSRISTSALILLDQCERVYGLPFPAALREWYSLADATEILEEYSNQDNPLTLDQLRDAAKAWHSYSPYKIDLASENLLPIVWENQYTC